MENETIKKMNKLESKIAKISQIERKLCYPDHLKNIDIPLALKEAAEKTDMLRKMVEGNSFSYLSETIEAMDEVVKSPTFQAATKHISDNKKLLEDISSSGYMESAIAMEQALKQFETSPLFSHITKICSVFPPDVIDEYSLLFEQISKETLNNMTNNISAEDIFNVDISEDGSLTYEGEIYSKDEIIKQLQIENRELKIENRELKIELKEEKINSSEHEPQVKEIEAENTSKKFDNLKKACEIVKIIIFFRENYENIINTVQDLFEFGKSLLMK